MEVWIDEAALDAATQRLAATRDLLQWTSGGAVAALQAVGLGSDGAVLARLLATAAGQIGGLSIDHSVRSALAGELERVVWDGGDPRGVARPPAPDDVRVAAAEQRVAALEAASQFPGRAQELAAAREELTAARLARLAGLVARLDQAAFGSSRSARLDDLAAELGVGPEQLVQVAAALRAGTAPVAAGLPEWIFPDWYVEAWQAATARRAERFRLEVAMWRAVHTATEAAIRGDDAAAHAAWADYRRWAERWEMAPPLAPPAALGLPATVAVLAETPYLTRPDRERAIAAFLAAEINAVPSVNVVEDVGGLIVRYLKTPAAAAAFFNELDPALLSMLPFVGFADTRLATLIEPYARVLALATRSSDLGIGGADVVGGVIQPSSVAWLGSSDYDPSFLIELAVAVISASGTNPYLPWIAGWPAGATGPDSNDPRVLAAAHVVARGPVAAVTFLSQLEEQGLVGAFVAPATDYADGGAAAGAVLALAGASLDPDAFPLVAGVVTAIDGTSVQAGVRQGAAAMIVPHLTALVDPRLAYDLEQSGAATALAGVATFVPGFLQEVLSDPTAATFVLGALTLLLYGGIDRTFEPDDPESVAGTMRGFGHLADLVTDAYLSAGIATARVRDAANARLATLIGLAADLAIAGGLIAFGPATAAAVITAEVTATGVTGLALPALLDTIFPTGAVEAALASGYELENGMVREAELYLLAKLHAAGVVDLPAHWFVGGRLVVRESDLRAFEAAVAGEFPYAEWVNDAVSIGGAISWQPVD